MSFNVSNAFKLGETARHHWVSCHFQFGCPTNVKQCADEPPITGTFNVSDVSYLNRLFENVFGTRQRVRKIMHDGRQDYTKPLSQQLSELVRAAFSMVRKGKCALRRYHGKG